MQLFQCKNDDNHSKQSSNKAKLIIRPDLTLHENCNEYLPSQNLMYSQILGSHITFDLKPVNFNAKA